MVNAAMVTLPVGRSLVQVRDLTCGHRLGAPDEVVALERVSLELAAGELVALAGPSGCGKTTLLRVLAGLDPPAAGQVVAAGVDLSGATPAQRDRYRRLLVGYVAQPPDAGLWLSMAVLENVQAPMLVAGVLPRECVSRALELLVAMGLGGRLRMRLEQLAGGELLRLALAVALANRPALLLVDEPAGELDIETVEAVLTDLRVLVRELGATTLIACRTPEGAPAVDRVVWLRS